MKKLLLIGPRTNKKDPTNTGGAVVLFENLLNDLKHENISYYVIDSNKENYNNYLHAYALISFTILVKQFKYDVISLHSSQDYVFLSPLIIIIGKLFDKTTSLRKFGGEAEQSFRNASFFYKKLLKYIFSNTDKVFLEMKSLVNFFMKININSFWYPNVRDRRLEPNLPRMFQKRFVFISQVIKEKGVDEILAASMVLDESFKIDIYGPIMDSKYSEEYLKNYNVRYLGPLLPKDVSRTLDHYDVLLLPSYKEGYPGIVIESYAMGVPVITTALQGLREIVVPKKTGLLVEPRNSKDLVRAMESINHRVYLEMSMNAYKKFNEFSSDVQTRLFLERLGLK
ncbi:glycosyltransferase [Candidatus Woesearchaeota archaeon]|nr:glycosyltransferase [Candidatus Woesearchaeota archaeon]